MVFDDSFCCIIRFLRLRVYLIGAVRIEAPRATDIDTYGSRGEGVARVCGGTRWRKKRTERLNREMHLVSLSFVF